MKILKTLLVSSILLLSTSTSFAKEINDLNKKIILKDKKMTDLNTAMRSNIENILSGVENIRKIKLSKSVPVGVKDNKQLTSFLNNTFDRDYTDKDIEKDYLLLEKLGLIKTGLDLKKTFLSLYSEQIAGFYDDTSKEFYVIDRNKEKTEEKLLEDKIIISHELVHALQDQNYNISKMTKNDKNTDSVLAKMALLEGEATVVSMQYIMDEMGFVFGTLPDLDALMTNPFLNGGSDYGIKNMPGFLVEQLIFPYAKGAKFVQEVKKEYGSWEKFGEVYKRLPLSTEQIIHPEKYLANEKPLTITINEKKLKGKKWKLIQKDILGEFFFYNYFLEFLTDEEAKVSADGWNGDQLLLYSKKDKNTLMLIKTSWDTVGDAQEFFDNYAKSLAERYKQKLEFTNKNLLVQEGKSPKGNFMLMLKDKQVTIAEGFDNSEKQTIKSMLN